MKNEISIDFIADVFVMDSSDKMQFSIKATCEVIDKLLFGKWGIDNIAGWLEFELSKTLQKCLNKNEFKTSDIIGDFERVKIAIVDIFAERVNKVGIAFQRLEIQYLVPTISIKSLGLIIDFDEGYLTKNKIHKIRIRSIVRGSVVDIFKIKKKYFGDFEGFESIIESSLKEGISNVIREYEDDLVANVFNSSDEQSDIMIISQLRMKISKILVNEFGFDSRSISMTLKVPDTGRNFDYNDIFQINLNEAKTLISEDNIEEALDFLLETLKGTKYYDSFILQSNNFAKLKKKEINHIVDDQTGMNIRSRIVKSILELIKSAEKEKR